MTRKKPPKGGLLRLYSYNYKNMSLLTASIQDESDRRPDETQAWIRDQPRLRGENILSHRLSRITPACAGKPDRHFYYIISCRGCQPFYKKKRRDLHPHPCPDHRPLFFRFHPAGCFELLYFAGHHPGASRREETMKTTTRSSYSIPHLH